MYGKALFFVVLVVAGAVLPYLLADDAWLVKIEEWMGPSSATLVSEDEDTIDKITTAGKPIGAAGQEPTDLAASISRADAATRHIGPNLPVTRPNTVPTDDPHRRIPTVSDDVGGPGRPIDLPRVVGPPGIPLEHLLSFDVTPEWIGSNWSRVTTRLADLDLQGWRVPISRGTTRDELAGSVTYYFDRQRKVQRILLHGYTADASEILALAANRYSMDRVPCTNSDLFAATVQGQVVGGLRVEYSRILNKENSGKRCEVLMELNRKSTSYGMSHEFARILNQAKQESRLLRPLDPPPSTKRSPADLRRRT